MKHLWTRGGYTLHRKSGSDIITIVSLFVELIENTPKYIFSLTHKSGDPAFYTS